MFTIIYWVGTNIYDIFSQEAGEELHVQVDSDIPNPSDIAGLLQCPAAHSGQWGHHAGHHPAAGVGKAVDPHSGLTAG